MGITAAYVPAPVPAQGVAARTRSTRDECEIATCGTRGSINAVTREAGCVATTETIMTIAIDPIAERPHGPNPSRRIKTTPPSVARPETAERIKYPLGWREIAIVH